MAEIQNDDLYSVEEVDPKQLRLTRRLAILWALAGIILLGILCYFLVSMIAALNKGKDAARVGLVSDFALDSVQTVYINPAAEFDDPVTSKAFNSLALDVVRDGAGIFHIFFARNTDPFFGVRAPRDCIVTWQDATQRFEDECSGSKWTREGKYSEGPAPRDLDEFTPQIRQNELWIELRLIEGAPHP